eukprot:COSAG06_NODE_54212_length_295_cov_5.035714_1_plen_28_part_10
MSFTDYSTGGGGGAFLLFGGWGYGAGET